MAETRLVTARVPESLEQQARASAPELLASLDMSTLLRAGLAALIGHHNPAEAVRVARAARLPRGGPRPGAGPKRRTPA